MEKFEGVVAAGALAAALAGAEAVHAEQETNSYEKSHIVAEVMPVLQSADMKSLGDGKFTFTGQNGVELLVTIKQTAVDITEKKEVVDPHVVEKVLISPTNGEKVALDPHGVERVTLDLRN